MSLLFFFQHVLIEATRVGRYHYTPPHLHTHFLDTVVSFRTNVQQHHHLIADNVCSFFLFYKYQGSHQNLSFRSSFFFSSFHQLLSNQATNKASSGSSHKTTASSRKKERENVITAVPRHKLYVLPPNGEWREEKNTLFCWDDHDKATMCEMERRRQQREQSYKQNKARCTHRHAVRATLPPQYFNSSHHCTRKKEVSVRVLLNFNSAGCQAGRESNGNGTVPSRRSLCRSGVRFQPPMATGMPARCQLKPSVHLGYSLSLALDTLSLSFLFHPLSSFIIYFLFNAGCVHNARLCFPAPEERRCSAPSSSARLLGVR